jgi:formylglycine-generating enzyme required for sulfatase activity
MGVLITVISISVAVFFVAIYRHRTGLAGPGKQAGNPVGPPIQFHWVRVEPGTFEMGDPVAAPSKDYDEHSHTVTIAHPYLLEAFAVTVGQFGQFVQETGYVTDAERSGSGDRWVQTGTRAIKSLTWRSASAGLPVTTPVTVVSWYDANAFCRWASERQGMRVRLPTEAEWEYACRAGTTGPYNAPAPPLDLGWFAENSGDSTVDLVQASRIRGGGAAAVTAARCRPHPVGQKQPNAWGFYDMHGNVWQWCSDAFAAYPTAPVTDPTGPNITNPRFRSARAAGWCNSCKLGTSYNRGRWSPRIGYDHLGFRVAAEVS